MVLVRKWTRGPGPDEEVLKMARGADRPCQGPTRQADGEQAGEQAKSGHGPAQGGGQVEPWSGPRTRPVLTVT